MQKRKLMIVIPYFYPKIGGLENYAFKIATGLHKEFGWEVVVVTSNHLEKKYHEEKIAGLKIIRLPYLFKLSNTPIHPNWYKQILALIHEEQPDLVNGHTPVPYIADLAALAAKRAGVPFVLTYQNDLEKSSVLLSAIVAGYDLILKNLTLPLSKKIITTTAYFLEKSAVLKKHRKKISIIPPGVELPREHTHTVKHPGHHSILFVGSIDKTHSHKGLSYLLDAVAGLVDTIPDVQLNVVGKGDAIPDYTAMAQKLGIEKHVTFAGFVPDAELTRYYHAASVLVLPSTNNSEGFGMVLIDAGAYHKPVVGTEVGGIPYVIQDNKTGILVPPANSLALKNALERILTSPNLASRLGETGYKNVVANYLWAQQVKKTHELFATI